MQLMFKIEVRDVIYVIHLLPRAKKKNKKIKNKLRVFENI